MNNQIVITNISTYRAIALDSHKIMQEHMNTGHRPKEDGSPGWIKTFDPEQKCFKQAMVVIVFTGMWLEALLHLLIVKKHGLKVFNKYDRKNYEVKFLLLGCEDENIIKLVKRFREARKELVHEKAYCDNGQIKTAQAEANNAYDLLVSTESFFSTTLK